MKPRACSARVRQKGMNFYRERPCKLAGAVEVGGEWFCRCHDPRRMAESKKKSDRARAIRRDLEFKIRMMVRVWSAKRK